MGEGEGEVEAQDAIFDRLMERVGNDGPFQKRFNAIFNFGSVLCSSMVFMNIILAMNVPDFWCYVPGRERTNLSIEEWRKITLPRETDNRGESSYSSCKMYNVSAAWLQSSIDRWNFTGEETVECQFGYEYDKKWYDRTVVSQENWVCSRDLFVTNTFVFQRVGEVVGTFVFGQLGDTLGRRPVFYISMVFLIVGRVVLVLTSSVYWLFAAASVIGMLTSNSIFQSPLIIALETSKGEDRAHIAMIQCWGWTMGMVVMPLVFWWVRDWIWFLMLTTLPIAVFALFPNYMLESPRWLATKGKYRKSAKMLQKIAKINGKQVDVNEKMLKEIFKENKVETTYGIASLFSYWRLAKNTLLIVVCWVVSCTVYFTLILNSARMDGNPYLNFLWQAAAELPAYYVGRYFGDKIGRKFTSALSFFFGAFACIPTALLARDPSRVLLVSLLAIVIRFCLCINFYVVNLHAMEIYPTCLRQTGLSIGSIMANSFGVVGPYIVYLGTAYDVRMPYLILGCASVVGFVAAIFLPETLYRKLPETLAEAQQFGRDQRLWEMPRRPRRSLAPEEDEARQRLNNGYTAVDVQKQY